MNNKGFTLLELMMAVAIIGILAAIAVPNLSKYLKESRRTDAIVALNELQQAQAKLRANCRWYGENFGTARNCAATAAGSTIDFDGTTESDLYTIAITAGSASGNAYTATATAKGSQLGDSDCRVFVLTVNTTNPNGVKSSLDKDNNASTGCW